MTRLVTFVEIDERHTDDRQVSVSARHEAVLADERRVLLLDDRGWAESGPSDIWAYITVDGVASTARTVVGPDEPVRGQTHDDAARAHWASLADVLRREGVVADGDALARLPHDVVLGERLRARLRSARSGGPTP
ncbi:MULTISPECIES: hypothetical protein [unclassified Actinotalea]|uniref:hypothetical protein n=1 Tax=unclassified Actinotalea TaxID=2638618 RepID=UPI0015F44FC2|nr:MULTISPECIES: hypothetical protein [unclassified Actinotalea]